MTLLKALMPLHAELAESSIPVAASLSSAVPSKNSALPVPRSAFEENLTFLQRGLNAMIRDADWVRAEEFAQALHQHIIIKVLEVKTEKLKSETLKGAAA